jgi:uncharacterized protein
MYSGNLSRPKRIGIIGGGVSGMTTAWLLQHDHEVTLFERAPSLGGHVETRSVTQGGETVHAELGPRFFFDVSYPYFLALLRILDVPLRWCDAQIAYTDSARHHTVVLPPRSPAQVWSLLRSRALFGHVRSLHRLSEEAAAVAAGRDWTLTLRDYLERNGYPASFGPELIYPFLAASWGAPLDEIPGFPAYSLLKGMRRSPGGKLGFYEIDGGMSRYMQAFAEDLTRVDVRLGAGVRRIIPSSGFLVEDEQGRRHRFDALVFATSSRDATDLLTGVPQAAEMLSIVRRFRHFDTEIVVHGDPSLMPPSREDWSHVNLFNDGDAAWMTDWSGWRRGLPVFRTWMPKSRPLPRPLYARRRFHHLLMSPENAHLQRRIAALQGSSGVFLVGMYAADVDNHESALLSALVPAQALARRSPNLRTLLGAVARDAAHDLSILPRPLGRRLHDASAATVAA